jgi:hypothetical protein
VGCGASLNNQLKTIVEIEEFKEIINQLDRVVFFVHSTWSWTSMVGLKRIEELIDNLNVSNFMIIDNTSSESFIYDWLKNQETKKRAESDKSLKPRVGSWIHGNGELFGVRSGNIEWFEMSALELNQDQLIEKIN